MTRHLSEKRFPLYSPLKYGLLAPKEVNGLVETSLDGRKMSCSGAKEVVARTKEMSNKPALMGVVKLVALMIILPTRYTPQASDRESTMEQIQNNFK